MSDDPVVFSVANGVAVVRLNRPERMNAVTSAMIESLRAAVRQARLDPAVRALVLTGTGNRAFCAGADLSGGSLPVEFSAAEARNMLRYGVHEIAREVRLLDKPYIAAVNGVAVGAGMDLVSMADLRFASTEARFSMSYVRMGITPGNGDTYYLPRIVGVSRALHLIWTGEFLDATTAREWGYLHEVWPPDEVLDRALDYARALADGPAHAIQMAKRLVYQSLEVGEELALELASTAMSIALSTTDAIEGPRAHAEGRPPVFERPAPDSATGG